MTKTLETANRKFQALMREKAEHWYFYASVEAKDEDEARRKLIKDYPRRLYAINTIYAL